jgi:mono/diheme cytochrome c family protein
MRKLFLAATLMVTVLGPNSHLFSQQPASHKGMGDPHAGQQVFTQNCFQCHSANEGQVRFGPSLYGEMKGTPPKKSATQIRGILSDGKGKMPSFKQKLTQQDMDNLIAYLHTL